MPAILFDIDGTLLDSVDLHARAWQEAFRSGGFPESDLRSAGARMLFDGPEDLLAHLERSPFDDRC